MGGLSIIPFFSPWFGEPAGQRSGSESQTLNVEGRRVSMVERALRVVVQSPNVHRAHADKERRRTFAEPGGVRAPNCSRRTTACAPTKDQCNLGSLVLFSTRAMDVLRWRNRVAGRLSEGPQISLCCSGSACAWSSSFWPACMLADQPLTPGWYTFNCVSLQVPRHCQISPIPM